MRSNRGEVGKVITSHLREKSVKNTYKSIINVYIQLDFLDLAEIEKLLKMPKDILQQGNAVVPQLGIVG